MEIVQKIAALLKVKVSQVEAAIRLLDEQNTVPFIARYRKEATQGLTDIELRALEEKLYQLRDLESRRQTILDALRTQGQLNDALALSLQTAETKARLEDLYLPYRPRRRTKAQLAKEAGLLPLAEVLLQHPDRDPLSEAKAYVSEEKQVGSEKDALEGAQQILMEQFSEEPDLLQALRHIVWDHAMISSRVRDEKKAVSKKYQDYFNYQERLRSIPSHRALALFRGRREEVLSLAIKLEDESMMPRQIMTHFGVDNQQRSADAWLEETVMLAWKTRLRAKLELEAFSRLKELAEEEGIQVFTRNLRALLMASPAGEKVIMGLDPGIRSGVKVVVIDQTGKVLDYSVVYPFGPDNAKEAALTELAKLVMRHQVTLVSIGNGTASRETEQLVAAVSKRYPDLTLSRVVVSEAGASVYSASPIASEEFPDLDVTIRGAVSIARRLQDPLAELVKIDPKAIGVGQYQHDVNQARLSRSLDGVVQDCVNAVGVDLNTASVPLLSKVAGLNEASAKQIVIYRDTQGKFSNREALKLVPKLGPKAFEQAAGFLRIKQGDNPLDASCVHPEAYGVVNKILQDHHWTVEQVMGNAALLKTVELSRYVDETHGLPTLKDVMLELEKPGHDPRPSFKLVQFQPGIEQISDLQVGMVLEGVVSNVTNFGAFVDVGVHQDGLVHISALANKFVSDPHLILKPGDVVTVRVIEVDSERRRIGLSMKDLAASQPGEAPKVKPAEKKSARRTAPTDRKNEKKSAPKPQKSAVLLNTSMADALMKWKEVKHD
ncbi:MAG: Tex family protein [Gammaproteobacteria bacterium]|nr:Tex family protein [Gammaproteobacteria bacterium]